MPIFRNFTPPRHNFCTQCFIIEAPADSSPGLLEAVDGVGLQCRQDGPQRGEVLQLSAFLHQKRHKKDFNFDNFFKVSSGETTTVYTASSFEDVWQHFYVILQGSSICKSALCSLI